MHALAVISFLRQQIYGRSRMPPLTALLQRQLCPAPPFPFRIDALLIQPPDWFEARVAELEESEQLQRQIDALRRRVVEFEMAMRAADD